MGGCECGEWVHEKEQKGVDMTERAKIWCMAVLLTRVLVVYVAAEELPTWTSVSGAEVQARFVAIAGDRVILESDEDEQIEIRMSFLIPDDQVRARELHVAAGDDDEEDDGPARLPTLARGDGAGKFVLYQHAHFDAEVDSQGRLFVHPKENGERVGPSIRFARPQLREHDGSRWRVRSREAFTDHSSPALNPRSVYFESLHATEEETHIRVEYTFDRDTITATAQTVDPRRPNTRSHVRIWTSMPRMADFPSEKPLEERKRILADVSMETRRNRSRRECVVWESSNYRGSLDELTITGLWGERTVRIDADNRRDGNSLSLRHYSGRPLYNGFSLRRTISGGASPGRYRLRVE